MSATTTKPRLRGIPDVVGVIIAVPAVAFLIADAQPGLYTSASVVYGLSLIALLTASATYHTPMWSQATLVWLKRIDHAAIFVLIAGTYTPVCLVVLPESLSRTMLTAIWSVATLGIAVSLVWPKAPRLVTVPMYLAAGWAIVPWLGDIFLATGLRGIALMGAGGVLYSVGALIYMRRWPDPLPRTFGYHEVFHTFVVAAVACHWLFIRDMVTSGPH